jgi:hypothetical protein
MAREILSRHQIGGGARPDQRVEDDRLDLGRQRRQLVRQPLPLRRDLVDGLQRLRVEGAGEGGVEQAFVAADADEQNLRPPVGDLLDLLFFACSGRCRGLSVKQMLSAYRSRPMSGGSGSELALSRAASSCTAGQYCSYVSVQSEAIVAPPTATLSNAWCCDQTSSFSQNCMLAAAASRTVPTRCSSPPPRNSRSRS